MSDHLLSKSLASHIPDPESPKRPQENDVEEERDSRAEVLLRTRVPAILDSIGANLDRTLSVLQRMERKLEAAAR
jgi:hypothetical protein